MARPARGKPDAAPNPDPWRDVYALHFPPPAVDAKPFEKGVGLSGYDRNTGTEVPREAVLLRPGETTPAARPFDAIDGKKLRTR